MAQRPLMSQSNVMGEETTGYGEDWHRRLRDIAERRAEQGQFPVEFIVAESEAKAEESRCPCHHGPRRYTQDEVDEVLAEATRDIAMRVHPVIVLVAGGGAAGKTVFTRRFKGRLAEKGITAVEGLELDHYFFPKELVSHRESDGRYDNPLNSDLPRVLVHLRVLRGDVSSSNDGPLRIPWHDRDEHELRNQTFVIRDELRRAQVILVEGLYCLGPDFRDLGDIGIYVDASPVNRAKGRIWRDMEVRHRPEDHVASMLMGRETYHQKFVEPTQCVADYIIRRPPTGGTLKVVYSEDEAWALTQACREVGIAEKQAELVQKLKQYMDQKTKERADKTSY